jgi:hypothetical protein
VPPVTPNDRPASDVPGNDETANDKPVSVVGRAMRRRMLGARSRSLAAGGSGGRSSRRPQHSDSSSVPAPR